MVIGNGLMASAFADYQQDKSIVIFASGVSNSTESDVSQFERELNLLKNTINLYQKAKLIYFSTCSVYDESVKHQPYVKHKLLIENFIQTNIKEYLIFRISNVVGENGNPNTIMNYLVHNVKNHNNLFLWKNAERNLIDKDDVKLIIEDIIEQGFRNQIVNVAVRKSVLVKEIIGQIEIFLNKKAQVHLLDKGNTLQIDISKISKSLDKIESSKGSGLHYIDNLLKKYY